MEDSDAYNNQVKLIDALTKIAINIKKDPKDRKTIDYFRKRLQSIEAYWVDIQYYNDRIKTEVSRTHPYFINQEFKKAEELYTSTKALINDQYETLIMRKGEESQPSREQVEETPKPGTSQDQQYETGESDNEEGRKLPEQSKSKPSKDLRFKEDRKSSDEQKDERSRKSPIQFRSSGSTSKYDDMLRKQASNFRAFDRTVEKIDIDSLSTKFDLEDAFHCLQSRWYTIDKQHWEIDFESEEIDPVYESIYTKHENTYNQLKHAINNKLNTTQLEITFPIM